MHARRTTYQQTVRFEGFEVEFHGAGRPRLPQRQSNEGSRLGERDRRRFGGLRLCSGRDGVYVAENFDVGRRRFVQRQVEEVDVRRKGVAGKYYLCTNIESERRYLSKISQEIAHVRSW